jgi:hypothetical protein
MRFIFISILVLMLTKKDLNGQSKVNFLEGGLSYLQPSGSFKRNLSSGRIGVNFGYLRQLKEDKPLFWGANLYYTSLGSASDVIQEIIDFSLVDFDFETTSHLLGFNGKLRYYPDFYVGKMEFYVEALLGYKWFYTTTNRTVSGDSETSDSQIDESNLSLTYGLVGGIHYPIKGDNTFLNLSISYLPGLSERYYIKNPNNQITSTTLDLFDLKKSTTDIFRYDLGITFRF